MQTITSQAAFLSDDHKKKCLIDIVIDMIKQVGVQVYQANADTESLIVSKTLLSALFGKPVVVVETDTDLLVVMVSLTSEHMDLYMFCGRNPINAL